MKDFEDLSVEDQKKGKEGSVRDTEDVQGCSTLSSPVLHMYQRDAVRTIPPTSVNGIALVRGVCGGVVLNGVSDWSRV